MRVLSLLLTLLFVLTTARADAAPTSGTETVREANTTLLGLLRKRAAPGSSEEKQLATEVTTKLRGFLDVDELGRRALGDHFAKLGAQERAEFLRLLRELVQKNYVRALRSRLDYEVRYLREEREGGGVRVSTEFRTSGGKGRPRVVAIQYVLHQSENSFRVFDLVTDGVGLVENYRSQFNQVIARQGVSGLLERMRKKAAEP